MNQIRTFILLFIVSLYFLSCNKPVADKTSTAMISDTTLEYLCSLNREIHDTVGTMISAREARKKLKAYKDFMHGSRPGYDSTKDVYGFAFGLAEIDTLRKVIDKYNANASGNEKITAVRVYFARGKRGNDSIADVFLVPVKKNGKNIVKIDYSLDKKVIEPKLATEEPVLNTSVPCPSLCDK